MAYVSTFGCVVIAIVFAASALGKVSGRARFRNFTVSLRDLRVLPEPLVRPVAGLVVAAEFAVVALLLPGPTDGPAVAGFALATVLLGGFTGAIVTVLRRGTAVTCRCFGAASSPLGRQHVLRNAALAGCAVAGAIAAAGDHPATLRAAAVAVPAALLCATLIIRLDDVVALFGPVPARR